MRKNPEILIGTPGRLIEHLEAGNLLLGDLEVLVLDESDRMLDMGFSEDVLRLAAECRSERQTLLFSATRGGNAMDRVVESVLKEPKFLLLDTVRDLNESIQQQIITADDVAHKERLVQWLLAHETYDKAVIFTNTREQADRLGGVLRATSHKVFVLHVRRTRKSASWPWTGSRMAACVSWWPPMWRPAVFMWKGWIWSLTLTCRSGDEYVHRIGRTGRVGGEGTAISLIAAHEWNLMASIQRYLRQQFEFRIVDALKGKFMGPKLSPASRWQQEERSENRREKTGKRPLKKGRRQTSAKRSSKPAAPDTQGGCHGEEKKTGAAGLRSSFLRGPLCFELGVRRQRPRPAL